MLPTKTLMISAIKTGTVIDHVKGSQALKILSLLNLSGQNKKISVAMNLPSVSMGEKDLIKLEDRILSEGELEQVAILSPNATVNIIQDYEVTNKFKVEMPVEIRGIAQCPNARCISNREATPRPFKVLNYRHETKLQCRYCHSSFSLGEV